MRTIRTLSTRECASSGASQREPGHTSLHMVRRYVARAEADLTVRHRCASPVNRLLAGGGRLAPRGGNLCTNPTESTGG